MPTAQELQTVLDNNLQHVVYWSKRLNLVPELWPDAMSVGKLKIIEDYLTMSPDNFKKCVSYDVAKAIGTFLAKLQNYSSLENAKYDGFKRANISYDRLVDEEHNYLDALSFSAYKCKEKDNSKWAEIYKKVKPFLTLADQELIQMIWYMPPKGRVKVHYKELTRPRHIGRRSKELTNKICKLAVKSNYSHDKLQRKILEQTRSKLLVKVVRILTKLNIVESEIKHNKNNSLNPHINLIINKEYA